MNDICCIGHITLDKIITPKQTVYMPGGTSYYFSHGMYHLKDHSHYKLVTSLAPSEYQSVDELRRKGIDVEVTPAGIPYISRTNTEKTKTTAPSGYWQKPTRLR